ncbi:MAG: hypothetical protein KAG66_15590, partial [Methylococcales bacterium]|nr:hypothetical protein [Methylococcales bacterium]
CRIVLVLVVQTVRWFLATMSELFAYKTTVFARSFTSGVIIGAQWKQIQLKTIFKLFLRQRRFSSCIH